MSAVRSLRFDEEPTEDALPGLPWIMRPCACGVVFYGPARRTECVACRTGSVVACEVEDDDEEEAPVAIADPNTIRDAARAGIAPAQLCRDLGLTAAQLVRLCARRGIKYPGVPVSAYGQRAVALQQAIDSGRTVTGASPAPAAVITETEPISEDATAEVELDAQAPRIDGESALHEAIGPVRDSDCTVELSTAQITADCSNLEEASVVEQTAAVAVPEAVPVALAPAGPFRQAVREGGLILPIRVEGTRIIVIDDWMVDGEITDAEAEMALAFVRGRLADRPGVEVVVGS